MTPPTAEPTGPTNPWGGPLHPYAFLDASDIPPHPTRGAAPIEHGRNPVPMRGEKLGRVMWRGRQWAVTDYGIEALDGTYSFTAARLNEETATGGWPEHMTEKPRVDSDDFCTAWLVAIALHGTRISKARVREAIAQSYPPIP
jgi:hypothetical protein